MMISMTCNDQIPLFHNPIVVTLMVKINFYLEFSYRRKKIEWY